MSRTRVVAAMVAVCLDRAGADPDRATELDTIRDEPTHPRR
jgi:hypothetical protein